MQIRTWVGIAVGVGTSFACGGADDARLVFRRLTYDAWFGAGDCRVSQSRKARPDCAALSRGMSVVPRSVRRIAAIALLGATVACDDSTGAGPAGSPAPGGITNPPPVTQPLDITGWIEAAPGDAPLVIVAPHGGELSPTVLPDRGCLGCVTSNDGNTQELAREIVEAMVRRTGRRPFLVINRLHRRKFDGNRDVAEATASYAPLEPMWRGFHDAIDSAKARALRVHPRVMLLDIHGHAHAVARLELGYLLTAAELRAADAVVGTGIAQSSIARLGTDARSGARGAELLRGPLALGTLLADAGVPAVPSRQDPAPLVGQEYFNGGYNTSRHGSRAGGQVDAIQIEHHASGLRATAADRARYADLLAAALETFMRAHYAWPTP